MPRIYWQRADVTILPGQYYADRIDCMERPGGRAYGDGVHRLELALTLVLVTHAWSASTQPRTPVFRSGVELVALSVSVVDRDQQFLNDLGRADFEVFENGVRRELTFFGAPTTPVDVVLLLDVSSSMIGKFDVVSNAAAGFVRTLRSRDRAAVIGFGTQVVMLQPFTSETALLDAAVRRPVPAGKTALYDALYIAANELLRERRMYQEIRRQALVILSDGRDTSSLANGDEALDAVGRAGIVVFTISPEARLLWGRLPLDQGREAAEAAFTLTTLARDSGGRAFFLEELDRLGAVYADVATEIQHQYTIGFEPDNERVGERVRQLLVRVVSRRDALVRTRHSYDPSQ
jgi:Ca-activated chloride channel family protein